MNEPIDGDELVDVAPELKRQGDIVGFIPDETLDLRPEPPPLEDLLKDGGRLLVVWALKDMPYREYLQTNHWQTVRLAALKAAGYRCQLCLKSIPLDVHHVDERYRCRGEEQPEDVIALCSGAEGCHKHQHEVLRHVLRARLAQQFRPDPTL